MPVLIISKFDEDQVINKWATLETPFSHNKSMEIVLDVHLVQSGRNSNSFEILCLSSCTCKFDKDRMKTKGVSVEL